MAVLGIVERLRWIRNVDSQLYVFIFLTFYCLLVALNVFCCGLCIYEVKHKSNKDQHTPK